jgi:hypothetical protein
VHGLQAESCQALQVLNVYSPAAQAVHGLQSDWVVLPRPDEYSPAAQVTHAVELWMLE